MSIPIRGLLPFLLVLFSTLLVSLPLVAGSAGGPRDDVRDVRDVSPARRFDRQAGPAPTPAPIETADRAIDGRFNNLLDPEMGAAHTPLLRRLPADYADGVAALAGADRPSPRAISNAVHAQLEDRPNRLGASDFLWQWGQFLDHDLDLTEGADPAEPAPIPVPTGDPFFDPDGTGTATIAFNRSIWDGASGSDPTNPRAQINEITGWIDGSNVYGSDPVRAEALRTNDGTGRLATSEGDLLPFNTAGLPNAGGSDATLFLAGDPRANEQVGLLAMHTLFVREHNRIVERLAERHPEWTGDVLYRKARQRVIALLQVITFREFLPALLGPRALSRYEGYDDQVDARIANAFSTAAYRFGHSALSPTLLRLDASGAEIPSGHLSLRDAFFRPDRLVTEGGIDPILRGLAAQTCQAIDAHVIDDVRNFLFGPPGAGGFDLPSLNIQRGRDHGLPSYNDAREALGFTRAASFDEINPDPAIASALASVYDTADDVDLWTGGLAEAPLEDGHLGETFAAIVLEQFEALRDGDRFWYTRVLTPQEIERVESTRLSDVIRANTGIGAELPADVFRTSTEAEDDHRERDGRRPRR